MNKFKIIDIPIITKDISTYFKIQPYNDDIIDWADKNIDFSDDISAERNRLDWEMYPYQKDVIKACSNLEGRHKVTFCGCEQLRQNKHVPSCIAL